MMELTTIIDFGKHTPGLKLPIQAPDTFCVPNMVMGFIFYIYVTLEHKSSLKSLGYICSNSQQYIVWVKIIDFSFMTKIIRTLSKDHVP